MESKRLKENLLKSEKEYLEMLTRYYPVKECFRENKESFVDKLVEKLMDEKILKENAIIYLACTENSIPGMELDNTMILFNLGYTYVKGVKGKNTMVENIFSEKEFLDLANINRENKEYKEYREFRLVLNAMINLYGVIKINDVLEIYNNYNKSLEIDRELLETFLEMINKDYLTCYREGEYIVNDVVDDIDFIIEKGKEIDYYKPIYKEFLKYNDEHYIEENKEFKEFEEYIRSAFNDSRISEELIDEYKTSVNLHGKEVEGAVELFEAFGGIFKKDKSREKFKELYIRFFENSRMWINKGHTLNEIK